MAGHPWHSLFQWAVSSWTPDSWLLIPDSWLPAHYVPHLMSMCCTHTLHANSHILSHTLTRPVNVKWRFTLVLLYTKLAAFSIWHLAVAVAAGKTFAFGPIHLHPHIHTRSHPHPHPHPYPQPRACMLDLFARTAALSHSAYQFSAHPPPLRTFQGRKSILLMKTKENFRGKGNPGDRVPIEAKVWYLLGETMANLRDNGIP